MAKKLSRFSPKALLLIFIGMTALIYGVISLIVLSQESQATIKQLQKGNGRFELESAKIFMEKYLEVAEDRIVLASQYRGVIDAVVDNDVEGLAFQLERFKGQHQTMQFAARDVNGDLLFEDTFRHPASEQEVAIFNALSESRLNERIVYLLHDDTNHICLKLFMPLVNNGDFVGVLYGETAVDYDDFFGSFVTGRERWYELSQTVPPLPELAHLTETQAQDHLSHSHEHVPTASEIDRWIINKEPLSRGNLLLTQGVSKSFLDEQLTNLQSSLLKGLIGVLIVSSIIVTFIGKRLFVNPHRELEKSKQELEESNLQLKEKEKESELLATVVKAARDAVVITDHHGKVEWVNKAFESMTGYQLDGIKGLAPGAFLQGADTSPETIADIGNAIRQGEQVRTEILNYTRNKQPYWIDIDIIPLRNEQGVVERFIAIERDITEVKRLESDLETEALKARHANEAKSAFLATMSHEIRTPLNGLLGMLQILIDDIRDPEQRKVLRLALNSGEHLISILNDILDLAKVESDALALDIHPFKMADIITPVEVTYQSLCSEKGILFSVDNQCSDECQYSGDSVRIRQVLLNLVGNALKFTKAGHINVSIKALEPPFVEFCVEDSGIGIPQDRMDSIFNEFEQAEVSTTRQYGGTGLGLAICQKLVTLMNGQISVESELGKGSQFRFVISLPSASGEAIEEKTEDVKVEDLSSVHALITDDNRMNQIIAKVFLDKLGAKSHTCSSGQEALNLLNEQSFNLIIIDNHMPEMSGIEVVKRIREQGLDDVVIFGWTADVMQQSTQSFIDAGADEVLAKPLIKKDLMDALSRHLPNASKE
ncbi:ATP-binding protein [Vibrio owensii]|uniref:PAS domain-containing hybrid sensor histidine kinase/response regulator n=1 Tax=Vibrio owensii TaxID=696485 RepID=UPI00374A2F47